MNYVCKVVQRELCDVPKCEDLVNFFCLFWQTYNSFLLKSTEKTTSREPFDDNYDPDLQHNWDNQTDNIDQPVLVLSYLHYIALYLLFLFRLLYIMV